MQKELSDIEQDLLIATARAEKLEETLKERDERICNLSYALTTCQKELEKQANGFAADIANISTLSTELLAICAVSPINEAEARRRALALKRISANRMPQNAPQ